MKTNNHCIATWSWQPIACVLGHAPKLNDHITVHFHHLATSIIDHHRAAFVGNPAATTAATQRTGAAFLDVQVYVGVQSLLVLGALAVPLQRLSSSQCVFLPRRKVASDDSQVQVLVGCGVSGGMRGPL